MRTAFIPLLSFLAAITVMPAFGQAPEPAPAQTQAEKDKSKKISLIAFGTPPMPRFVIKGGMRELVDIKDDGSFPPQVLFLQKGKEMISVPLALNSATKPFDLPATSSTLELLRRTGSGEDARYHSFLNFGALPEFQDLTVLICRRSPKVSWHESPKIRILKNDLEAFPLRTIRAVNLSSAEVGIRVEGIWTKIRSGASMLIPMNSGKDFVVYDAASQGKDGETIPLARSQTLRVLPEDRANLIFYDNDGIDQPDRPIKLLSYSEQRAKTQGTPAPNGGDQSPASSASPSLAADHSNP